MSEDLADALAQARAQAGLLDVGPWRDSLADIAAAYRVQTRLAALAGDAVAGWKVTALNAEQQTMFGIDRPIGGAMLGSFAHTAPATLTLARFVGPLLECEIAYRLARDLPARGAPYTRAEIAEAVDALVPAYEIADLRVPAEAPGLLKVADCVGNGAFIAGPAIADWRAVDLGAIEVVLSHNGDERARGPASRILGDPLMAVVTLANAQPLPAGGLKRGQIVTTGTCTTPLALERGQYVANFGPLGTLRLTVT
jgi:2-keto-4-pentenoate hydratase